MNKTEFTGRSAIHAMALMAIAGCNDSSAPVRSEPVSQETAGLEQPSHVRPPTMENVEVATRDDKPLDATLIREQALAAFAAEDAETADRLARQLFAMDSDAPENVFLFGQVLAAQNRFAEAIHLLDRLAESVPEARLPVLGQSADWMVMNGQWAEAESRYRTILDAVPDAAEAHRKLAMLFLRQGRRIESQTHLNELCRRGNVGEFELRSMLNIAIPFAGDATIDQIEAIGGVGAARSELGLGNTKAAIDALSGSAESPAATGLLNRIHAEKGDYDSLAESFNGSATSADSSADHWFAKGTLEAHQGKHQAAIESFSKAVRRDPTDRRAYRGMSRSLEQMESDREAKTAAERVRWLEETFAIGDTMAASPQRSPEQIEELARLLDSLHRPFESLAWRAIGLSYRSSSLSQDEARGKMSEINNKRLELLQSPDADATASFILCGVESMTLFSNP